MDDSIDDAYFLWLGAKVADLPAVAVQWDVLRELHGTEFAWLVVGDDNRAMDGIELRTYFCNEVGACPHPIWMGMGCSILELFIAFAMRCEFQTDIPVKEWFWMFIENLGIKASVNSHGFIPMAIQDILHLFIWRLYEYSGYGGGLFPLRDAHQDQRQLELWYQFNDYIVENHLPA